jgi:hypothetical protein
MKKILFLAVLAVSILACKKENKKPVSSTIVGTWELRVEYGGIAGITNHYAPGNGHKLQLNVDSTFKFYENSTISSQGTFSIIKNSIDLGVGAPKLDGIYYNHNTVGQPIQLKADTLTIGIDFDDQIASVYVRN